MFTTNQVINGYLKINNVDVVTTIPTLNSHFTSKLYVDNQVALTAKLGSVSMFTANETISGNLNANNATFTGATILRIYRLTMGLSIPLRQTQERL
jgi:hypothetical protein